MINSIILLLSFNDIIFKDTFNLTDDTQNLAHLN